MKEIVLIHYTVPPDPGGVESLIYHHVRLLNANGFIVRVIAGSGDESYYEDSFHHQIDFIPIAEINPLDPKVFTAMRELAQGRQTGSFEEVRQTLVKRLRPYLQDADVCILHNVVTSNRNLPLTAALHDLVQEIPLRWVAWVHEFPSQDVVTQAPMAYPWDLLQRAWPGVNYVFTTEGMRAQAAALLKLSDEAMRVIPAGVDENIVLKLEEGTQRLVEDLNLFSADPLILLPCPINPRQNIELAFEVVQALRKDFPHVSLLVTGSPSLATPSDLSYLEKLETLCRDMGLNQHVHLLYEYGEHELPMYINQTILSDLYQLADLLLCPSCIDVHNPALLAAALVRLPVFALEDPIIRDQTLGLADLFDPDTSPQMIALRIANRLRTDRLHQLRRKVLTGYTWDAIYEKALQPLVEG